MAGLLDTFTPEQIEALKRELSARSGSPYDRMTDRERWEVNKTLTPTTNKGAHIAWPKVVYGVIDRTETSKGRPVQATVKDQAELDQLIVEYPYDWRDTLGEHGFETYPANGRGVTPVPLEASGAVAVKTAEAQLPGGMDPGLFAAQLAHSQAKRGPGRPKNPPKP